MVDEYNEHDDFDEYSDLDGEGGRGTRLPDSIRKALVSGLSAVLTTEEGIRNALGDMRLPKEALAYLAQQTERTRRELFSSVGEEIRGFLKGVDLTGELRKALTGLKVQVKAEITFSEDGLTVDAAKAEVHEQEQEQPTADPPPATARKTKAKKKARKRKPRRKKADEA